MIYSHLSALYVDETPVEGRPQALPEEEARHVRALRLAEGREVLLLDGRGTRAIARIERIDKRGIVVRTASVAFEGVETGPYIVLSFGLLADKTRLEWCVEKCVELGVAKMTPLETERSEGFLHRARVERIARAALKQSQRAWLPEIDGPLDVTQLIESAREYDRVYVCHEAASESNTLARALQASPPVARVLVVTGPEGGFSEAEVERLEKIAEIVSLGEARLRAETAAIVAVALVRSITGGISRQ